MMLSKSLAALFVTTLLVLGGCQSTVRRHTHFASGSCAILTSGPVVALDTKTLDPLEFLSHLKAHPNKMCVVANANGAWVQEGDLSRLFELLDSGEKCASVEPLVWEPYAGRGDPSTVGREAARLIHSFRTKFYPAYWWQPDNTELRRWWNKYLKEKD